MLLVGAGLLIRSFLRVLDVNLGYHPERAAALRIDPGSRFANAAQRNAFIDEALRRTRSIPGIMAVGLRTCCRSAATGPGASPVRDRFIRRASIPEAFIRVVSEGYFAAAGIPLRAGREFTERDRHRANRWWW